MTSEEMAQFAAESAVMVSKRSRQLFGQQPAFVPQIDSLREASLARRKRLRYGDTLQTTSTPTSTALVAADPRQSTTPNQQQQQLVAYNHHHHQNDSTQPPGDDKDTSNRILVKRSEHHRSVHIPTPTWHAPWKLATVLSSHLGWVRSIAVDTATNKLFATGSADRTIKVWNLAAASVGNESAALQYTLTGHISAVRGLAFSTRHPYLFSCGEDKQVKSWDLETNQVVRHYHGHLSGVYCLSLHPTVDVLVTGGRDAVARVWDIRTKKQVHCLSGHDHTVGAVLTKTMYPQVITASHDCTVRLWDLVAGKSMTTLTHHAKSIRTLCQPSFEQTFCSGGADGQIKRFQGKDGKFLATYTGHKAILNAMAVNDDGVLVSGGDDGSLQFWDYKTGYNFQQATSQVQPGSLDSENSIMVTAFDATGTRLITGEGDKTIKIWKQDEEASELTHPIDMVAWRKKCIALSKQRY